MQQTIRYTRTADGVHLAWARAGDGKALVKASNWLTHLEFDWDSPVWRHWTHFLAANYRSIRYDERGCGMSDWAITDSSYDHWFEDFDRIIEVAEPEPPFILLGISQGGTAAISYAARHPDNVSHLILYGAYARGWARRDDPDAAQRYKAICHLTRLGWGQDNPVYRQVFTARFIPEGTPEQFSWFNELCHRTTTPEIAELLLEARGKVDVTGLLPKVSVPTLVLHSRLDEVAPLAESKLLASRIPGAKFVALESRNHITRIFEKLGVQSRAQAIVLAKDRNLAVGD
jgi:pimeloyl-ACP methyl ester carboxylesterase